MRITNNNPVGSIQVTGIYVAPGSLYYKFDSGSNYTIVSGDRLRYEIMIDEGGATCRPDGYLQFVSGDAKTATDQNGLSASVTGAITPDISPFAKGKWYARDFDLNAFIGSVADYFVIGEGFVSTVGIVNFYVRKIRIVSSTGDLRKAYFSREGDAAPTLVSASNVTNNSASIVSNIASTTLVLKGDNAGSAVPATLGTDYLSSASNLDASKLATNLVPSARLGTGGTGAGTKSLFDDQTFKGVTAATIASTLLVLKGDNAGNAIAATLGTDYLSNASNLNATNLASGTVANARLTSALQRLVATTQAISGAAPAIDWSLSTNFSMTLSVNTVPTFSNATDNWEILVAITNTASNYTVTWPAGIKWVAATQPTQTLGAKTDLWGFAKIGTIIYGVAVQNLS